VSEARKVRAKDGLILSPNVLHGFMLPCSGSAGNGGLTCLDDVSD